MEAVAAFRIAAIPTGDSLTPILPLINDSQESIDAVVGQAAQANAQWVWHNVLFLKSCARAVFLPFVEREFPEFINRYRARYNRSDFLSGPYLDVIRSRVDRARHAWKLDRQSRDPAVVTPPQLEF